MLTDHSFLTWKKCARKLGYVEIGSDWIGWIMHSYFRNVGFRVEIAWNYLMPFTKPHLTTSARIDPIRPGKTGRMDPTIVKLCTWLMVLTRSSLRPVGRFTFRMVTSASLANLSSHKTLMLLVSHSLPGWKRLCKFLVQSQITVAFQMECCCSQLMSIAQTRSTACHTLTC